MTVKQPVISSHTEKVSDSKDKSEISNRSKREGQPFKDSETITGQSENLISTSSAAVEAEVAKKSTFNNSGSIKKEQKQPLKKDQSIPVDEVFIYYYGFLYWYFV